MKMTSIAAVVAASLLASAPAGAGSLAIGPIRVQMIGPERTATLTVRNTDTAPVAVQVRTVDWSQPEGVDDYVPSAVLLASPPLVTLAPGESQVIRLVVENMPEARTEKAFRVILDEIPDSTGPATGVQATIRALVPVFVTPSTESRPNLRWSATRSGPQLTLTAVNEGAARERLLNLQVSAGGQPIGQPMEGYILSGGRRVWTVDAGAAQATAVSVSAEGEYGTVQADVPVTP